MESRPRAGKAQGAKLLNLLLIALTLAIACSAGVLVREPNSTLRIPTDPVFAGYALVDLPGALRFDSPVAVASPPGTTNELFVVERAGRIFVITNLMAPTKTLFLDLSTNIVASFVEAGLLGLAFHPGYATNGYFYTLRSVIPKQEEGIMNLYWTLARFQTGTADPNKASRDSESVLIQQPGGLSHNGGDLHFGAEGYLYISCGDHTTDWSRQENPQPLDSMFASAILRIDVDKRPGNLVPNPRAGVSTNYLVPADNPFVGITNYQGRTVNPQTLRTEFYAIGLRNPWRFSFDSATGDLYCGDVGAGAVEEVNLVRRGANYGWPYLEGESSTALLASAPAGFSGEAPLAHYWHGSGTNQGGAIIGGAVYRGTRFPELYGAYLFADNTSGNIWSLKYDGTTNPPPMNWLMAETGISAFGIDPGSGDVLVVNHRTGLIKRLIPVSPEQASSFPPDLRATGAFLDLDSLRPHPGIVPYEINVPFWSDHASKRRWFSIPNPNPTMLFNPTSRWEFPNGTVWIKHFEIEMIHGVPESRRRLETRFLVKNSSGGYGVTYRWDVDGNAYLVPAEGMDEPLEIRDGADVRRQLWHYPGRGECMSCHNPDFDFALGFNTPQLNRTFAYPAGEENQLRALSQAGYFGTNTVAPERLVRLAHAANTEFPIQYRTRSYFAANCFQCHQPGTRAALAADWDARFTTRLADARLLGRLIVPGSPDQSELLSHLKDPVFSMMPPIATTVINTGAINLVTEWIRTFPVAPWTAQDIGMPELEGSSSMSDGLVSVSGSGVGFLEAGDEFHFLSQPFTSGMHFTVQWQQSDQISPEGVAGLMVRLGSASNAPFAMLAIEGSNTLVFLRRESAGAAATSIALGSVSEVHWLRMQHESDEVRAFHSSDYKSWTLGGSWASGTSSLLAGFAVTARNRAALRTAQFRNVTVNGVAINAPTNGAAFTAGDSINLLPRLKSTNAGGITIEFFAGEQKLGATTTAPYLWTWTNPPAGLYQLRARLTDNSGAGVFSDPVAISVALPETRVDFVHADPLTGGDWTSKYGRQGLWIAGYRTNLPEYLELMIGSEGTEIWSESTMDPAALRKEQGDGIAAGVISGTNLTLQITPPDSQLRRLALYFLDWRREGIEQLVRLIDPGSRRVLDSREVADFGAGTYLVWIIRGKALVEISSMVGPGTMLSGIFLDAFTNQAPSVWLTASAQTLQLPTNVLLQAVAEDSDGDVVKVEFFAGEQKLGELTAPPYVLDHTQPLAGTVSYRVRAHDNLGETASSTTDVTAANPPPFAQFYGTNEVARGNWKGVFGTDGFDIISDARQYPFYLASAVSNAFTLVWGGATAARALQRALGDERLAAVWYGFGFDLALHFRDGHPHLLSFYFLDWDSTLRHQRISFFDAQSGGLLDTREVSNFYDGKYLSWIVRGDLLVRFDPITVNAVVSGVFFDPAPATDFRIQSVVFTDPAGISRLMLSWRGSPGRRYRVQFCADLSHPSWSDVTDDLVTTSATLDATLEFPQTAPQGFYRVLALP